MIRKLYKYKFKMSLRWSFDGFGRLLLITNILCLTAFFAHSMSLGMKYR